MPDLTADERRELEEFLAQVDGGTFAIGPGMAEHVAAAAELARLTLKASGPAGTEAHIEALNALLATTPAPTPWAQGWDEPSQWTDDRVPQTPNEFGHRRAQEVGQRVARGWIGHPTVAREVESARPALKALVEPLLLVGQKAVTYVTARLLDVTGIWPDGTEWPNPFAKAPVWLRKAVEEIQPGYVVALRGLATRIADAGAPLDPADLGGWLVLAQLALLDVDLTGDLDQIVNELNTIPPGWIDRDAAQIGHVETHVSRHGRNARFIADLQRSGEVIAKREGPPPIQSPYAGGRKRSVRSDTQRLRDALAALVAHDPVLTPGVLLRLVAGADHPALVELRAQLGERDDWLPDRRRLERNWPKSQH